MSWLRRYRVRHYCANSMWVLPTLGMPVALAAVRATAWLDSTMGWESAVHSGNAMSVLDTMSSAMFTFVVFVSSVLLIAVQLSSAQLSPRIIGMVFKDPIIRFALTLFVFTYVWLAATMARVGTTVPLVTVNVAAVACLVCLGVFLVMIDHVGKALRPSGALRAVARRGRQIIDHVYPKPFADLHGPATTEDYLAPAGESVATIPSPEDGVVVAFDQDGLVALARAADCVIEMVPEVGDHVAAGDPLFRVRQGKSEVPVRALCHSIAVGQERTLQQDPTFAFRIMVDIASKALSPAINDPTTAVLAIDQIHHLLRVVGGRNLDTGRVRDAAGRLRLIYRTPDWEDFVRLAVTEIRQFGAESIQVARRLHAMLEHLIQTLPAPRADTLRQELAVVQRSNKRFFAEPEDRALAEEGDFQGVGGKKERTRRGASSP
jgi:uncharacterized membrane protein